MKIRQNQVIVPHCWNTIKFVFRSAGVKRGLRSALLVYPTHTATAGKNRPENQAKPPKSSPSKNGQRKSSLPVQLLDCVPPLGLSHLLPQKFGKILVESPSDERALATPLAPFEFQPSGGGERKVLETAFKWCAASPMDSCISLGGWSRVCVRAHACVRMCAYVWLCFVVNGVD